MPVAFFFAEHKEMLHRLSAGLCLSRASAAERQAKNDRNYSNACHSKPPRCRPPTQLFFTPYRVVRSKISARKCEESGPVRTSCVAAGMLTKCYVAGNQCGFHRRKFGGSEIFFSEQLVHRAGA